MAYLFIHHPKDWLNEGAIDHGADGARKGRSASGTAVTGLHSAQGRMGSWSGDAAHSFDQDVAREVPLLEDLGKRYGNLVSAFTDYHKAVETAERSCSKAYDDMKTAWDVYHPSMKSSWSTFKTDLTTELSSREQDRNTWRQCMDDPYVRDGNENLYQEARNQWEAARRDIEILRPIIADVEGWSGPAGMPSYDSKGLGEMPTTLIDGMSFLTKSNASFFLSKVAKDFPRIGSLENKALAGSANKIKSAELNFANDYIRQWNQSVAAFDQLSADADRIAGRLDPKPADEPTDPGTTNPDPPKPGTTTQTDPTRPGSTGDDQTGGYVPPKSDPGTVAPMPRELDMGKVPDAAFHKGAIQGGTINDTWLLAALGVVGAASPAFLRSKISFDKKTGKYTVRLYRKRVEKNPFPHDVFDPVDVEVDAAYFTKGAKINGEPDWVSIYEAAVIKHLGGVEAMDKMDITPEMALEMVTGRDATMTTNPTLESLDKGLDAGKVYVIKAEGDPLNPAAKIAVDDPRIVPDASYMVTDVARGADGSYTLSLQDTSGGSTTISMTQQQFSDNFEQCASVGMTDSAKMMKATPSGEALSARFMRDRIVITDPLRRQL